MKKPVFHLIACSLLAFNAAHAGEVAVKQVAEGFQYDRFDRTESLPEFTLQLNETSQFNSTYVSHYKLPAPLNGRVTSTLCVIAFEVDRVEKSGLFAKTTTVQFKRSIVNASRLQRIALATPEEKAKLGLAPEDDVDLRRIELVEGNPFFAIGMKDSRYVGCGVDAQGMPQVDDKLAKAAETQRPVGLANGVPRMCFSNHNGEYESLPTGRYEYRFARPDEAKRMFDQCRVKEDQAKREEALAAEKKAQAVKDANARYEKEKSAHKMTPGVQILGTLGAARSRDLIYRCSHYNFMTDSHYTKEEWKQSKCQEYYPEEVDDLQREMRVRGLVDN